MKKKILVLANNYLTLYLYRLELIEKLLKEGNEVYLSFPKVDKVSFFTDLGFKYIETKVDRRGTNIFKDLTLINNYREIVKKVKPDVVLTFTIKPNIYGGLVCRNKNIKCIANITGLGSTYKKNKILSNLIKTLYKLAFKNNKCIFCQNKEIYNYFISIGIDKKKLKIIPGSGVNLEKYQVLEYPKSKYYKFLFAGRIMTEKGIKHYLETAERIKKDYPTSEFNIIGYCEEDYEEILKDYQNRNIIKYHGMQDSIIPFLKDTHCVVHPTYYPEGMSNVLLEAAASGRPVITTNRSGCREVVDNNYNGLFTKEKDTEDLYKQITKFINLSYKEKKQMGLNGRAKVEKTFDRNIVINAYLEEIEK